MTRIWRDAETKRAMELAGLDLSRSLKIADVGFGTDSSTSLLATKLDADITVVDFLSEFLESFRPDPTTTAWRTGSPR
jgi:ubiquinone/menaquinone biosynthesis C-methylase UbiE